MHRPSSTPFLAGALLALALAAGPAGAEPRILPDSTVLDIWQLSNGLRVVVRHLPKATHVAVTVAAPTGTDADPRGQAGRASLLAELWMTAEAGDTPERTRAELDLVRPAGWGSGVSPRVTQFTEIGTRAQFPGILRQMAQRLRGVTVSDSSVARALANLHGGLAAQRSPTSNVELYQASRDLGLGGYDPGAAAGGLKALGRMKPPELQALVRRTFVPRGTVLSLAGNLGEMNLPALIENEFGGIPAGEPPVLPEARRPRPGHLDLRRDGLREPAAVTAIVAPALEDTLHPTFYLSVLFLGGYCQRQWQDPPAPLTSRFQYSLFDDPDLVRFYPPLEAGSAADSAADMHLDEMISKMGSMIFPAESFEAVLRGVAWLVGAPLPPETQARATRQPRLLATLASNQAVRELWGGEPFWNEYRRRLVPGNVAQFQEWVSYLLDREHRIKVMLHPPR